MEKYSDRRWAVTYDKELRVNVERAKARFSTWYEMFPRSLRRHAGRPRHLQRLYGAPALRRRNGFRRPLSAAHSSHRQLLPQRQKQCARRPARRRRAAPGPSAPKKAATRPFTRSWDRWRISSASSQKPRKLDSKSPWTSLFSARRIIPMSRNIRSGFANVRTDRSNTRKIRRKNIRTSIRWTSRAKTGRSFGRS